MSYITHVKRSAGHGTTIVVDDSSVFSNGDIIEFPIVHEQMRVTNVTHRARGFSFDVQSADGRTYTATWEKPWTRRERLARWLEPKAAWVRRNGRAWAGDVAVRLSWVTVGAGFGLLWGLR